MKIVPLLNKYGISQSELARRMNVDRSYISKLKNEDRDIYFSTATNMATAIGCSFDELAQYINSKEEENK